MNPGFITCTGGTILTNHLVHCDREILSGIPVFTGTRVPVKNLIDYLAAGDNIDDFLDDFPSVSREQATEFLQLALKNIVDQIHETAA